MGIEPTLKIDSNNLTYIDLGTAVIRMEHEEPPEWALEIARNELREVPEVAEEAKQYLKEMIDGNEDKTIRLFAKGSLSGFCDEKGLSVPTEEMYLKIFLRPTHYYAESAAKRMLCFYNMRSKYGEACSNILPAKMKNVFDAEIMHLLPNRDQHGRRILVLEAGKKWKPSKVPLGDLFRGIQMMCLGAMIEPLSQICGAVVIIDMEGLPMGHVMQFTPTFAAMLLDFVQECICIRLKGVHIVNNSYIFNVLFAIFKPFIKEKLRKRIHFHGKDYKSLAKHLDASILPTKYGGTATWEMPSGKVLYDFFNSFTPDFERVDSYGYPKGYVKPQ